jgi:hypothetical protein
MNNHGTRNDMKQPRIPPLLVDIIQSGLVACDGIVFDSRDTCPLCSGKLSGYDTKKKQFAVLYEKGTLQKVHVFVKRFSCYECNTVCFAEEPFYPDTRIGSPVADLCIAMAAGMPFNRTADYLWSLGIIIDRGTVRNYAQRFFPDIPMTNIFGIRLPLSIVSLSELAARAGEGSRIEGAEVLAACGFPSAYRAAPDGWLFSKKRNEWQKKEDKEKRQAHHPENDSNNQ